MLTRLHTSLERYRNVGLLVLRVGVGLSFVAHGWPKIIGGPERWMRLASFAGIDVLPTFFGFMAALSETGGGLLLALGLLFRPATFLLFCTMAAAFSAHLQAGDGFSDFSHALELGFVFAGLFITGPGRYSLDDYLFNRSRVGF